VSTTVRQLADLVQGQVLGDGAVVIRAARCLDEAGDGDITFLEHERHAGRLADSRASCVVANIDIPADGRAVIRVKDPLMAFVAIVRHMQGQVQPVPHGIDAQAAVHPSAQVGPDPSIFPFAVIGAGTVVGARCRIHPGAVIGRNCRLGDDVTVYANAVLYDDTVLGHRVTVHGNAVLGADGFGYRFQDGRHVKVPQLGNVEIGDDVEVGACTTIDRGTFQATRVGAGTKIDNLVQVGHNCQVGRHNLLVSQVGMAGSSGTGDFVVIAGQVGVVGHVHIGTGAIIGGQAGVTKDVPAGQRMLGSPATPERDQKRMLMTLERLPEMRKDLHAIKQRLGMNEEEAA
jgi:UDP-3-O-[3-hydroxymyristoyl] glucosamine N-acyltransferase